MNIEKYNKLHNELMKKLEAGEITTEQAKEINDLAFDKYITESKEETFPSQVKLEFFNKIWNCKVTINQYSKDDYGIPNIKLLNDFIKKSKQISKSIEKELCSIATREYQGWSNKTVSSYSEINPLTVDLIYFKYENNKWNLYVIGKWDPDIEHGFSLIYKGNTLIYSGDASIPF
jgi:hypothetical protein